MMDNSSNTSMKGFTKEENDYFWNNIKEKSTTININTNADEMLKNLGYIKDESFGGVASYILSLHHLYPNTEKCVDFNEDKTVSIHVDDYNVNATAHLYIWDNTPQEIEAIYTKIKELGWL